MKKQNTEMDKVASKIATYFIDHINPKYLAEWIAMANEALMKREYNEETSGIGNFLYYLGGIFLPNIIGVKTNPEQFAAIKEHLPEALSEFVDHNQSLKRNLSRIGVYFLEDYPEMNWYSHVVEKFMGTLIAFMSISEMMEDYEAYCENSGQCAA